MRSFFTQWLCLAEELKLKSWESFKMQWIACRNTQQVSYLRSLRVSSERSLLIGRCHLWYCHSCFLLLLRLLIRYFAGIGCLPVAKTTKAPFEESLPLQGPGGVDISTKICYPVLEQGIWFLSKTMLKKLGGGIFNISLYSLCDKWWGPDKLRFQKRGVLLVFATLLEIATKALNVVRHNDAGMGCKDW